MAAFLKQGINCMCGIVGIVACSTVNQDLFDALTALQHRGQDAAGMATSNDDHLYLHKGNGLVRDVFRTRHMRKLPGNIGIAHVRYPTAVAIAAMKHNLFMSIRLMA